VDTLRRRLLDEDWDLAIGITDLPLRSGRRPVTAHASASHGVGLLSLPGLGGLRVGRRARRAAVHVVEGLVGESVGVAGDDGGRAGRLSRRLKELASPLGHAQAREDGSIRFVGAALTGNLRLLMGMVRANQPWRVIVRLSRALVGALGTGAFALASSNVWQLADGMSWARLLGLAVLSVVVTCVALVLYHDLWERAATPEARERVILFNITTVCTLALGVTALYLALFMIFGISGAALIPPDVFRENVQHSAGVGEYAKLAWLTATLASVGGALASMVESDESVREAVYRNRADERTEALEDRTPAPGS
jgi:uncharacterized membrane protein